MKQLLPKLLKVFLGISLLLVGLSLVFGLVLLLGWPWWVGFFVLIGLLGLSIGLLFLKKLFQRKREQDFVQQVISEEAAHAEGIGDKDRERSQELQARWKEAMDALRNSHLKKMGNPLYVLPWYLVIGESGSGKTTAIKSARLSSPFAEVSRTSGISGTRNCDWWFFEQAIIIDTAGRYAIPVDEGKDKEEWQRFLSQLARFRKREPLNGLVITVAANKLLSASRETLEKDGHSLRLRIDELMRVLGAKFPVYLLITKCDLIQGMTHFCNRLPGKTLDQAMGILNHALTTDIRTFHERAMHTMGERLKDLRLQLLHQPGAKKTDPELLLFPEEFERLTAGLAAFAKGAFQENPYQETPILRGLFFSSGRQEGSPYSHFLNALNLIGEQDVLPGTSKGMFLFDFFSRILPGDRGLFTPTLRATQWTRLTRNLGLTAWVAIMIAVCGLLSFSFVKNLRVVKEISAEFSAPPVLQGDMLSDVIVMDRFRQAILKAEDRNRDWWIPRFGLTESLAVETRLKETYDTQFRETLLPDFDEEMAERMTGFTEGTPAEIGSFMAHLVRRINLLQGRLAGDDLDALRKLPPPGYDVIAPGSGSPLIPELKERFHNLYLFDLMWRKDRNSITQEITMLQTWLKHLLGLVDNDLSWVITWVNTDPDIPGISLSDFWGGTVDSADETAIPPAYTLKGKEAIDRFITEMESALPDPLLISGGKATFRKDYGASYLKAWQAFGATFQNGKTRLSGRTGYQKVADRIAAGEGPYFSFLARITQELAPFKSETDSHWVDGAYQFETARQEAASGKTAGNTGILSKADQKLKGLLTTADQKTGTDTTQLMMRRLGAATAHSAYQDALTAAAKQAATRKGAFDAAAEAFRQADLEADEVESPAQFLAANRALQALKTALETDPDKGDVLSGLISGPLSFLWEFSRNESACYLNDKWEETVLLPIEGMRDQKEINSMVLGDKGLATALIAGDAAPFIDRSLKKGYFAKTVLGETLSFEEGFFAYLNKGSQALKAAQEPTASGKYSVTIKGMPTDVNKEARVKPHATHLEMECGGTTTKLVNLNYPVKKAFEWISGACGDVVFEIEVGTLVLTKRYAGSFGFPDFLGDFDQGGRRLYPKDFPDQKKALEGLGITYIKVNYVFDGHRDLLNAVKKTAAVPGVPGAIAQCWE